MRRLVFRGFACTTLGLGGAGTYAYAVSRQTASAPPKCEGPEMGPEEWNKLQDRAAVERSFASPQALRQSGIVLYWLYGCPYCARVRALLDFHDVPYTPVVVDPVNFQQLNPMPYRACPQLHLTVPQGGEAKAAEKYPITEKGPFVADSEEIIKLLAATTKTNLAEPRIVARREWIKNDVARLIFVAGGSSFSRAYNLMPHVTPSKYHSPLFRAGGAIPMWLLAKYKITGRVKEYYEGKGDQLEASIKEALGDGTNIDADKLLSAELKLFSAEAQPFHGGKKPDQVDVELFGLLKSQIGHKPITEAVERGNLDEWYARMDAAVPSAALTDRVGM